MPTSTRHKHTPETIEKMRQAKVGRTYGPEHRQAIAAGIAAKRTERLEQQIALMTPAEIAALKKQAQQKAVLRRDEAIARLEVAQNELADAQDALDLMHGKRPAEEAPEVEVAEPTPKATKTAKVVAHAAKADPED